MSFNAQACEKAIGYVFKDKNLLERCCTHSSYAKEKACEDNDRLEFFGDSIIEYVVTEYLYKSLSGDSGKLTDERKEIVSKAPLLASVEKLGLDKMLLMSKGLRKTAKKDEKLFSDVYEAIVAGIYLDGGMEECKSFIYRTIIADYEQALRSNNKRNKPKPSGQAKSLFQEFVQKYHLGQIKYKLISRAGSEHQPIFTVALMLDGQEIASASGSSKKQAETTAASKGLDKLKKQVGKQN